MKKNLTQTKDIFDKYHMGTLYNFNCWLLNSVVVAQAPESPNVLDNHFKSLKPKEFKEFTTRCWLIGYWNCPRSWTPQAYHMAQWLILKDHLGMNKICARCRFITPKRFRNSRLLQVIWRWRKPGWVCQPTKSWQEFIIHKSSVQRHERSRYGKI